MGYTKKEKQISMLLWHGTFGIKRFDTTSDKKWITTAKKFGKSTDICISNSRLETEIFRKTFWPHCKILEIGQPSNDILLKPDSPDGNELRNMAREKLGILPGKKVLLYAPTYRNEKSSLPCMDFESVKDAMANRFEGDWVIVIRLHYESLKQNKLIDCPDYVIDGSGFGDIGALLLLADAGITDYSSWICNYILTKKPGFLYVPDYVEYDKNVGFYQPLESLPYPVAYNINSLIESILTFDEQKIQQSCSKYLSTIQYINADNSSSRVASLITSVLHTDPDSSKP